jgi:hypothetical protein
MRTTGPCALPSHDGCGGPSSSSRWAARIAGLCGAVETEPLEGVYAGERELADEAERLGPPEVRRGRPPLGATSGGHSPRLSTLVPQDVNDAVRAAAEREGVTPAQWLRDAIEQRLVRR